MASKKVEAALPSVIVNLPVSERVEAATRRALAQVSLGVNPAFILIALANDINHIDEDAKVE